MADSGQILSIKPALSSGLDYSKLTLDAKEAFLLSRIDGSTTIKQLAQLTGMSEAVTLTMLEILVGKGAIQVPGMQPAPVLTPPTKASSQPQAVLPTPPSVVQAPKAPESPPDTTPVAVEGPDEFVSSEFDDEPSEASRPSPSAASPARGSEQSAVAATGPAAAPVAPSVPVTPIKPRAPMADLGASVRTGTFAETPLLRVIADITSANDTGILRVTHPAMGSKDIYCAAGLPVFVDSHVVMEKECLGRLLKFAGKINEHDLQESIVQIKATGKRQGEVLLSMGSLSKQELDVALRWQVEIKLADVFTWDRGAWAFYKRSSLGPEYPNFKMNLAAFLHKAVLRGMPAVQVQAAVAARLDQYVARKQGGPFTEDSYSFTPREKSFLEQIDGTKKVRDMAASSDLSADQGARVILLAWATGLVELKTRQSAGGAQARILEELEDRLRVGTKGHIFDKMGVHWTSPQPVIEEAMAKAREMYGAQGKYRGKEYAEVIRDLAADIYKQVEQAYAVLRITDKRRAERAAVFDKDKIEQSAELQFQRAETIMFWREDYKEAAATLESAADLMPGDYMYSGFLGAALMCLNQRGNRAEYERGRGLLDKALVARSKSDVLHYAAGFAYWKTGKIGTAKKEFEAALALNPQNRHAVRALRQMAGGGGESGGTPPSS